jgi:hypothetical protein
VTQALAGTEGRAINHVLQDPSRRREVASRMSLDVCIRSNPLQVDGKDIDAFLTRVVSGITR